MITVALALTLGLAAAQDNPQEKPRVPKDSLLLVVTGCLKGRVLAVSDVREVDTQSGPIVRAKSFRVQPKNKDASENVKRGDRHLVEVTGLVRKSALIETGVKVGKGITIGGGPPVAGSGGRPPAPSEYLPVIDADSVQLRSSSCSGG